MTSTIGEPRVVEAGRGAAWWTEAFRLFTSNVWTWIGIMVIYLVISMLMSLIPFVGDVAHWLLTPVFMGGLMLGCQSIERDGSLRVAHLFEGFQGSHFVQLMIIGAVNIAMALAIGAIVAAGLFGGIKLADMMSGGDPLSMLGAGLEAMTGAKLLVVLVVLVIVAVFAMLNWFAPALVALRGVTAVEAMKLSFFTSLRNWVPFLVYGLIAIAVWVVLMLVIGGLAVGLGATAMADSSSGLGAVVGFVLLLVAILAVVALVVGPIVFASVYASYRDAFDTGNEKLGNPAYR